MTHPLHCPVCQRGFNTVGGRQIHAYDAHGFTLISSEADWKRVDEAGRKVAREDATLTRKES